MLDECVHCANYINLNEILSDAAGIMEHNNHNISMNKSRALEMPPTWERYKSGALC